MTRKIWFFFFLVGEKHHLNDRAVLLPDSLNRNLRWHFYTFHSLRNKAALFPLSPLSFVLVCRTGQESTAAVVVSVGSAFPRLTAVSSCKSTEIQAEKKTPEPPWGVRLRPPEFQRRILSPPSTENSPPPPLMAAKGYMYLLSRATAALPGPPSKLQKKPSYFLLLVIKSN